MSKVYLIQDIPGTGKGEPKYNIVGAQKYGDIVSLLPEFSQMIHSPIILNISGTTLPYPLRYAAVVEDGNSFNMIGGSTDTGYSDKILKYDPNGGQWTEVQTSMSRGKGDLTAMKVKPSFFSDCP